jgi:prolyl-tRNA synthetase
MEFLWQEGHTAHATRDEALEETRLILDLYANFVEDYMAIPVIKGVKTASERFAGADDTFCIEALMQDGKALQAGTSHFLGQNFAKAFDCQFQNKDNELEYVWATSWGVSTRLIGALVMIHSDDQGLVIPPRLAPTQVVIVPIYRKEEDRIRVLETAAEIRKELDDAGVSVKLDDRESQRPGWKFHEHEVQGVPVRIAIGPRDLENGTVEVARRDVRTKEVVAMQGLAQHVQQLLDDIQKNLYTRALAFREEHTSTADTYDEFKSILEEKGGFVLAHWDGTAETEAVIKNETKATIRCIPLDQSDEEGVDMVTGKPSSGRVIFARAY